MKHKNQKVLEYWNRNDVESMYDKHLLKSEIRLIKKHLKPKTKILDAGCGEGEGTFEYSSVLGIVVHAVDFSDTRLRKAKNRLKRRRNVIFKKVDFLQGCDLDKNYDFIISQRFIINLMEWKLQRKVLLDLMKTLKRGGKLLLLEGSRQGVDSLNKFRKICNLDPIPIRWHNLFLDDNKLVRFMKRHKYKLLGTEGLGTYFLLTRGIRPLFDKKLNWNSEFNKLASSKKMSEIFPFNTEFSRLKLWIFQK